MLKARLFHKKILFDELEKWFTNINWTVVTNIVLQNKNCVKLKSDKGQYLLHYACQKHAPEDIVLRIIELHPEAAQYKDNYYDSYPLHYACRKNQSTNVILKLIAIFPQAVQQQDNGGSYPLYYACNNNQSKIVILYLIELFPQPAQQNPLCYLSAACDNKNPSDSVVLKLIEILSQKEISQLNDFVFFLNWFFLPRILQKQSEIVVLQMIELFSKALMNRSYWFLKDINYWFFLHHACESNQTATVVDKLICLYPDALQHMDSSGYLPLHCACAYQASLSVIKLLVLYFPAGLDIVDNDNKTPLDLAREPAVCRFQSDETVVQWLNSIDDAKKLVPRACYSFLKNQWINASD